MRRFHRLIVISTMLMVPCAYATPDRESLIAAWEQRIAEMPATTEFEKLGNGEYTLRDTDLPYEGRLKLLGALVRDADQTYVETDFTHTGLVDFQLVDLPVERVSSQSYYYWLTDRQTLYYSAGQSKWLDPGAYHRALSLSYNSTAPFGALTFMLNYGIWVLLIGLIAVVFVAVIRQAKKARTLMDETAAINQQARDNLDRSKAMQDEVMAVTREMRDLQVENNATLERILQALGR